MKFLINAFCIILAFVSVVTSSSGDRSSEFKICAIRCFQNNCNKNPTPLPLYLRITLWSCEDNCKYHCQREITQLSIKQGSKIHQYYGKWPFKRILGIQEPASVIFSLLNGYFHYVSWKKIDLKVDRMNPSHLWLKIYVVIGVWVWSWSAIFHTRDFIFTERMDYHSASILVIYLLFIPTVYLVKGRGKRAAKNVFRILSAAYLYHVFYLQFIAFSYRYNMIVNASIGLCANIIWMVISYKLYRKNVKKFYVPVLLMLYTDVAFSLEALDFPPLLDMFDAHSLWHAATIPVTYWWYEWLINVFSSTFETSIYNKAF
ncbi:hypothetical protein BB561_003353 [Smittium simulii]|uniref:Post-GPI attachment to proteins factor 3 n=1 Tax=Smittium simulii TaxID=133385 RepID=A0A2T9YLW1_9FUNG|nr:hypothetical protein BB561_003353 [Smittium simulii]